MTNIGVFSQPYQSEDRSWLLSEFDDLYALGATLDITTLTAATHYPNGYLPSGTALGLITAQSTGTARVVGPYDDTATDGRQTCLGLLVSSVRILNPLGQPYSKIGVAVGVYNGVISLGRLPFNSTNASSGRGYIDANAQADLKFLYFAA